MTDEATFSAKKTLRRAMREANRAVGAPARDAASRRIFDAVERLPAFAAARTVALFEALGDEPATHARVERWAAGRRVVLPRVEGDTMRFYDYRPGGLAAGAFGIAEPAAGVPCPPEEIDLAVCPGVAFTRDGRRLGRGRGYYDRYLSRPEFRGVKVGVCYTHQLVEELPAEPHDVRMDVVIAG